MYRFTVAEMKVTGFRVGGKEGAARNCQPTQKKQLVIL